MKRLLVEFCVEFSALPQPSGCFNETAKMTPIGLPGQPNRNLRQLVAFAAAP